jgi:hypothetical protein
VHISDAHLQPPRNSRTVPQKLKCPSFPAAYKCVGQSSNMFHNVIDLSRHGFIFLISIILYLQHLKISVECKHYRDGLRLAV